MNKYNKNKKQFEKDQQLIKSFDKLRRKSLQDNIIDKKDYISVRIVSTKFLEESKNESFL